MKAALLTVLFLLPTVAFADTYVSPYVRSDGTYVQGHYRTAPDNTIYNNYTTYPNVNPYTGQTGTIQQPPTNYQPAPTVQIQPIQMPQPSVVQPFLH